MDIFCNLATVAADVAALRRDMNNCLVTDCYQCTSYSCSCDCHGKVA